MNKPIPSCYDRGVGLLLWLFAVNPALDTAQAALGDFDARAALTALEVAKTSGPLTLDDHIRYYEYLGIAHAYLEHEAESLDAFSRLLRLSPGHAIAYTLSPQVTFVFQEARRRAGPEPKVTFSWPPDREVGQTLPVVIEVLADPAEQYATARLFWRAGPDAPFDAMPVPLAPPGAYVRVEIPPDSNVTNDVTRQLYLGVYDAAGNEVSRVGDPSAPREARMRYVPPTSWYERWWVWAGIGVVAAAGVGAAVYATTRPEPTDVDFGVRVP